MTLRSFHAVGRQHLEFPVQQRGQGGEDVGLIVHDQQRTLGFRHKEYPQQASSPVRLNNAKDSSFSADANVRSFYPPIRKIITIRTDRRTGNLYGGGATLRRRRNEKNAAVTRRATAE